MEIIVATRNQGKMREFARILEEFGCTVIGMEEAGVDMEIEEDGSTFGENATIKAMTIHKVTGKPAISDDSGLCVDYLDGRPGVYSARYQGEDTPYPEKIAALLAELKDAAPEERTARFTSAICFVGEDSTPHLFEASCEGTIGYECRGENGFGYDPIFYVGERSFAQLSGEEKDAMSHRGKALRLFAEEQPQLLK